MNRNTQILVLPLLAATLLVSLAEPVDARGPRGVRSSGRASVSHSRNFNHNTNINRNTNVNVNRNVHVDVDRRGGYYGGGCCYHSYHPVATIAAVAVTAAVVGSIVAASAMPPSCATIIVNGLGYQQCGSVWYQPQLTGSTTTYVVVNAPR